MARAARPAAGDPPLGAADPRDRGPAGRLRGAPLHPLPRRSPRRPGHPHGAAALARLRRQRVGFYAFAEIAKPKLFRDTYREQLDTAPWDAEEKDRVIAEVARAFELNGALFDDLATATTRDVA